MKALNNFAAVIVATSFRSTLDFAKAKVDRENGIIRGVSLISEGEARGHGQFADATTLNQVRDCASEYEGGLRVKFNSKTFNHGDGSMPGYIPNETLRIVGKQLLGDLHFYENYPYPKEIDYLCEMASKTPRNVGFSIEFNGLPEEIETKKFARCDEIFAATIVDIPAANATGLFRVGGDQDESLNMKPEEIAKIVADALKPVTTQLNQLRARMDNPASGDPTDEEKVSAGCTDDDTPEIIAQKVSEWRANLVKPATVGDVQKIVMNVFKMTGGKPARPSGNGEGAKEGEKGDKDAKGTAQAFSARVDRLKGEGLKHGTAVMAAKRVDGKGYNAFVRDSTKPAEDGK